jgi:polysaccharide export outer membrane protein
MNAMEHSDGTTGLRDHGTIVGRGQNSEVTGLRLSTLNPQPSTFFVLLFLFLGAFELFAGKPQFQDVNALVGLPTTTTNKTAAAPSPAATNIVNAGFTNGFAGKPQFQDVNALWGLPTTTTNKTAAAPSPTATNIVKSGFTNTMGSLDDEHRLAIGDCLSFRIEEDLEDPKALVVTDSGDLEVPYIGRFPAETKTCKQLARELKAALEKEYYYQATVIIAVDQMAKSRGKVYLVGPVRVPGPQEIPSDEILTLSKAIMRAGGFNDFADKHNVKVTRKARSGGQDKKTFVVDVGQIFDKGKVELDLVLEPDDLILIPERLVRF